MVSFPPLHVGHSLGFTPEAALEDWANRTVLDKAFEKAGKVT